MITVRKIIFIALFILTLAPTLWAAEKPQGKPALNLIHALGCKGCHIIQKDGSATGPDLTQVGSRLTAAQIQEILLAPVSSRKAFMPAYTSVKTEDLQLISNYLYQLR